MYTYVTSLSEFGNFITDLQEHDTIYLDTETTGLDPFKDKVVLIQIKLGNTSYIFDTRKLGKSTSKYIVQLINDTHKKVVGFNLKFDLKMLATNYGELLTNAHCLMLAEILIHNGIAKGKDRFNSLASLVERYTGEKLNKEIREEFYNNPDLELTEQHLIYAAQDVEYLKLIEEKQLVIIEDQKQGPTLHLEMLLLPVVCSMEINGITLDKEQWSSLSSEAINSAKIYEQTLLQTFVDAIIGKKSFTNLLELAEFLKIGKERKTKSGKALLESITDLNYVRQYLYNNININSSDQILIILRDIYEIPVESTNEKIINKFIDRDIVKTLIDYREQQKKISSFSDNFFEHINSVTNRIHTDFNQLGAQSGRFASSKPNLQNIPKESEYRKAFIAPPGKKIIAIDFSQEELRLLAVVAKVKRMIETYRNDGDIHLGTAAGLYNKPESEIIKSERNKGKSLNFAVGYGSTEWGLWKNFGIAMEEGRILIKKFYEEVYPEINQCKLVASKFILQRGYSTTLNGRKRFFEIKTFFPGGNKERDKYLASILREGFNHIIQGTGADIIKESLCRIFYENPFGDKLKIILQVYDEIVCEADEDIAEEAAKFIENIMLETERKYLKDVVPAKVDTAIGDYWIH